MERMPRERTLQQRIRRLHLHIHHYVCEDEVLACFLDEECAGCMNEEVDDDTQIDDDFSFEDNPGDCDEVWDATCIAASGLGTTCTENERFFDLVRECSCLAVGLICLDRKLSDVYLDYFSSPK